MSDYHQFESEVDRRAFYEGLQQLQLSCGTNKHDQAIVLITACIDGGLCLVRQIIGMLVQLDFHQGHVARMLKEGRGAYWLIDGQGRCRPLPKAVAAE